MKEEVNDTIKVAGEDVSILKGKEEVLMGNGGEGSSRALD